MIPDKKIINLIRLSNVGGAAQEDTKVDTIDSSKQELPDKTEKQPDRILMEILGVEKATND